MVRSIVKGLILALVISSGLASAEEPAQKDGDAKVVDFKKLKSPIPYTKQSIKRGRLWYMRECTGCHGPNGKALIDIIADAWLLPG